MVHGAASEATLYAYNSAGQRVRKITERRNGTRRNERLYVGGFEVFREYDADGDSVVLQRETLHVMDDKERVALVETLTRERGHSLPAADPVQRFQLANHLGSATLELDEAARLISYEEYAPYGETVYEAGRHAAEVRRKRYRYTGKERDEENGFTYHGARYCAPWLGRWTSCDPAGLIDGVNLFAYARNAPLRRTDPGGTQSADHAPPAARTPAETQLSKDLHQAAENSVKTAAKKGIPHFRPHVPKAPQLHLDLPPPPRISTGPNQPLTLAIEEPPPELSFIPPLPQPKEPVDPKPVDAPNSLYSSWTNSSSIAEKKEVHLEFNEQVSSGTAGGTVTSQLSGRVGVGAGVELGLVGNLSLGNPIAGAGGATVHLGTTDLDEDKYASGAIFQVTGGKGEDPSGSSSGILAASGSYLAARGGKTAPYETDLNLGAAYATFGTFGPGATSAPHLLSVQGLALRNWYLDPRHANSAFAEALAAPTVALGTIHDATPLYGLRVGAGAGFSTTGTGSLLTFSANAFLDATSRGVGAGGAFMITYGWKPGAKAPDQ